LRYLFEDCALDMDRRELHRGPEQVAIEPQVFDLLAHLIRHRDRVVSKSDLLDTIWKGAGRLGIGAVQPHQCRPQGDRRYRRAAAPDQDLPRKGLRFVARSARRRCDPRACRDLSLPDRRRSPCCPSPT
jgi:DNA-binding winged helix-turn-helix (wHTH) protein